MDQDARRGDRVSIALNNSNIESLPPEILEKILSHLVTNNDYRYWIMLASVCKSFARCLGSYMPFDEVQVGRSTECVAVARAAAFPRCYFPPPVPVTDALPLQLMERSGPVSLSSLLHKLFVNNITNLNVMACCPRTCTAVRVMNVLPQMRHLRKLTFSLSLTGPDGGQVALLVRNLPASLRELNASFSTSSCRWVGAGQEHWLTAALEPFSQLTQLQRLSLDAGGLAPSTAQDLVQEQRVRAAHYAQLRSLLEAVGEALQQHCMRPCCHLPTALLQYCRTQCLQAGSGKGSPEEATLQELEGLAHSLGAAVGTLRVARPSLMPDDAAAVQEVLDNVERECGGKGWLDLRPLSNLQELRLQGILAACPSPEIWSFWKRQTWATTVASRTSCAPTSPAPQPWDLALFISVFAKFVTCF
eukprot:jgi/Botrbrau1/9303/Bobra.0111s0027.1